MFFWGMDLIAGKKHSLPKAKLLEILACIPYREWELKAYFRLTKSFRNNEKIYKNKKIIHWGRDAQDNEYLHLLLIHEKMKEDNVKDKWYLKTFVVTIIVYCYVIFSKILKYVSLKSAFYFNAQFEDHAEHVYAEFIQQHPELEHQKADSQIIKQYSNADNWADVFRQVSLDEREHRNNSFLFCGKEAFIAK